MDAVRDASYGTSAISVQISVHRAFNLVTPIHERAAQRTQKGWVGLHGIGGCPWKTTNPVRQGISVRVLEGALRGRDLA